MPPLIDVTSLVGGLVLLVIGGDWLVRGGAGMAKSFGVSPLIIGLTVVSFGTSAPELAVNMDAAVIGATDLSFGNIVGSNIANLGLILAIGALLRPLRIEGTVVGRELPTMLLVTAAALILGLDSWFDGMPGEPARADIYGRGDGVVLLLLFCIFLYNTARDVISQRAEGGPGVESVEKRGRAASVGAYTVLLVIGIVGLVAGAHFTVVGARNIALSLGVPEVVVGLTVVAFGTSLPELVATVIAALRSEMGIAVGNVIGSNVFNLCFVMGATSAVRPIPVPAGGSVDLIVVSVFSVLVLIFCLTGGRRVGRIEGAVLFALYCGYIAWMVLSGRVDTAVAADPAAAGLGGP